MRAGFHEAPRRPAVTATLPAEPDFSLIAFVSRSFLKHRLAWGIAKGKERFSYPPIGFIDTLSKYLSVIFDRVSINFANLRCRAGFSGLG
jgi:hypothetical protein